MTSDARREVVAIAAFALVAGIILALIARRYPPRELTCAEYANARRERVPARCFSDYRPETK
jgi:hypothetical protein